MRSEVSRKDITDIVILLRKYSKLNCYGSQNIVDEDAKGKFLKRKILILNS